MPGTASARTPRDQAERPGRRVAGSLPPPTLASRCPSPPISTCWRGSFPAGARRPWRCSGHLPQGTPEQRTASSAPKPLRQGNRVCCRSSAQAISLTAFRPGTAHVMPFGPVITLEQRANLLADRGKQLENRGGRLRATLLFADHIGEADLEHHAGSSRPSGTSSPLSCSRRRLLGRKGRSHSTKIPNLIYLKDCKIRT
jgi:hypothetical protein